MKKVSRIHIFILALSMAYSPAKAFAGQKVGIGACIVGAAASVVGFIGAVCPPESNKHMLERIQRDYDNTTCLMPYVTVCQNHIHHSLYAFQEDQLYTFLHISLNNTDIAALEYKVQRALGDLASGKRELQKRIKESARAKSTETLQAMKVLLTCISEREDRVSMTLKALFDCHGSYFKLVQYSYNLAIQYAHEISVLNGYHYDEGQVVFQIKSIVSSNRNSRQYPFVRYYDDLARDQEKLRRCIAQLSHTYPEIIDKAQQLLRHLEYIRSIIAISPEYTRDMLQKEQDAIREAQRQLAAQQERFRCEQEWAQYKMRMAQIDLAIQQMSFKNEQTKELKKNLLMQKKILLRQR